jgi:fructan beta-fructosidase
MRPHYHYAPAANWLSDPNGLVHYKGEWHLFYQYNPQGEDWGHMSWGHAVSSDLATWQELEPALLDDAQEMIFSGSAVIDTANHAGFGHAAMVAIYTGAAAGPPPVQSQCLAASTDAGRTWSKYPDNPVLDRSMADFRDPNVFWHEPSERWIMVVVLSNEQRAVIYGSRDLKQWDELSVIPTAGAPGAVWECPLLIELPVDGTKKRRWLFKVDVLRGAPGSGALYQTGSFDGVRFQPDGKDGVPIWGVADWGSDFYAAIAWHEPRDAAGRPAWIGWMGNHAYQGKLPEQGWRGAMSLPRRLSLRRQGDGYALIQQIEPAAIAAVPPLAWGTATAPPVGSLTLPLGDSWLALVDETGRILRIERRQDTLFVSRRDPVTPALDTVQRLDGCGLDGITIWLDCGSIELLSADGSHAITLQHRMTGASYTAHWS